jgi:hypothetical protein
MFQDIRSCDTEICNEFLNLKSHDQLILIKILLYHVTLHLEITQRKDSKVYPQPSGSPSLRVHTAIRGKQCRGFVNHAP